MSSKKKRSPALILVPVALVAIVGVGWGLGPGGWLGSDVAEGIEGATVQRGPLRITVVERGNLESSNSVSLNSAIEGSATILYLIDEGTEVQPGTLLCELDTASIEDRLATQRIAVANAEAVFENAKQQKQIQISQNTSDVAAGKRALEFAIADLRKYEEGDYIQLVREADQNIALAKEQLERDRDQLAWSEKLFERGFLQRTEYEADVLTVQRSEIELDRAERQKVLLEEYEYPRTLAELKADVEEAERELERIELQAAARRADAEAALSTSEAKLAIEVENLEKFEAQIDAARIIAPVAGMVVYGRERGSRWGDGDPIAEGTQVRERQEIIRIPVTEGMIAEVSLHESVIDQVGIDQTATLTFDAIPGREFSGSVRFKAPLPDKNSWWANPNLRLYRTEVRVFEPTPSMQPGMTCNVEILVDSIEDCLYVPLQSIFLNAGRPVVFLRSSGEVRMQEVETGRSNHKWVEILSGLDEGQVVLLSQPPGFQLEPAPFLQGPVDDTSLGGAGMGGQDRRGGESGGPGSGGPGSGMGADRSAARSGAGGPGGGGGPGGTRGG